MPNALISLLTGNSTAIQLPLARPAARHPATAARSRSNGSPVYSKIFRWHKLPGQTNEPKSVAVVGSFNNWKATPMAYDARCSAWQVNISNIPGARTHHYMLLVDGLPAFDPGCDGYAVPADDHERAYQMTTPRGPRVLMLFAQAK